MFLSTPILATFLLTYIVFRERAFLQKLKHDSLKTFRFDIVV